MTENNFEMPPLPPDASRDEAIEYGKKLRQQRAELSRKFDALKADVGRIIEEAEAAGNAEVADEFRNTLNELAVRQARHEEQGELNDELARQAGLNLGEE